MLSEEEKARDRGVWADFEELMEALRERLEEQDDRHEGGNKWIGTAGTSPFGAYGYQPGGRTHRPVRFPQSRRHQSLGPSANTAISTIRWSSARAISSLRCGDLRKFARVRALPISWTLTTRSTRRRTMRAYLDIRMVPERHNAVKVLLCLDIGGSMDDHVRVCEELFLGGAQRVQASGVFLLPQLRL